MASVTMVTLLAQNCVFMCLGACVSAHPQEQADLKMQKKSFNLINKAVYVRLSFLQIISVVVNESGVS